MSDAILGHAGAFAGHAATSTPAFSLSVVDDIATTRVDWERLERRAVVSPYQRYEFNAAWSRHAAAGEGVAVRIGLVKDRAGETRMVLPFGLRALAFAKAGVYLGGTHVNIAMPLVDERFARTLGTAGMLAVLRSYCHAAGADLLALRSQPECWMGMPHPFLRLPRRPSPMHVSRLVIDSPFDALYRSLLSSETRSKLRRKEAQLLSAGIEFKRARTPGDVDRFLAAFLELKSRRLATLGAADPFAAPGVPEFLAAAAKDALGAEGGFELAAAECGDELIAVRGAVRHGSQVSLMIQAFDPQHNLSKHSPGEVQFSRLLADDAESGLVQLDFGVDDERYKRTWSNASTAMFDTTLPATLVGNGAALVEATKRSAVRTIKRNEVLFARLKAMRMRIARLVARD